MKCPYCGKEFKNGAKFCENCGSNLSMVSGQHLPNTENASYQQPQRQNRYYMNGVPQGGDVTESKKKQKKVWLIAVIVVVGIIAAAVFGTVLFSISNKTSHSVDSTEMMTIEANTFALPEQNPPQLTEEQDITNASTTKQAAPPNEEKTYQSIFDEYSQKLRSVTPVLIEEYNAEAANNNAGITGLGRIYNSKIMKLSGIRSEGSVEMGKVLYSSGSGNSSEYLEWVGKLQEVYSAEADKITDTYMSSTR